MAREINAMNKRHLKMDRTSGRMDMSDLILKETRNEKDIDDEEEEHAFNENNETLNKSIHLGYMIDICSAK